MFSAALNNTLARSLSFTRHQVALCLCAAEDQDDFHHLLHARLDAVLRLCEPRKTVTFALDGPAPLAKLITQR